jgi:cyanate lyase
MLSTLSRVAARSQALSRPACAASFIRCQSSASNLAASPPSDKESKLALVKQLIAAKEASGKSFTQISKEVGLTNLYTAQLFYNQAQLKEATIDKLRKAVPALTDDMVQHMKRCPMRSWDPAIKQEPHIYRTTEAVLHYGEAIKAIMNEELGDGIMSAIDMYASVDVIKGKQGEKRFVITLNGKFLPHVEQQAADNTAELHTRSQ